MNPLLERISIDPAVCHGRACVRGTRVLVHIVVECLANGDSVDDLVAAYPALQREDVFACLTYAAQMSRERIIPVEVQGAS